MTRNAAKCKTGLCGLGFAIRLSRKWSTAARSISFRLHSWIIIEAVSVSTLLRANEGPRLVGCEGDTIGNKEGECDGCSGMYSAALVGPSDCGTDGNADGTTLEVGSDSMIDPDGGGSGGSNMGLVDGSTVGGGKGCSESLSAGSTVNSVGVAIGAAEDGGMAGCAVGSTEGASMDRSEGLAVASTSGSEGGKEVLPVGSTEGNSEGEALGCIVGYLTWKHID
jgi:hypothetical protein